MVCFCPGIYWANYNRYGQPLRSFLLVFLIFPRISLFNFTILSYVLTNDHHRDTSFDMFSVKYGANISLGGRIHKKTAFHAYLGRMQYCKSLVILIKSALFNWIMYFSFANAFFPSKFQQIRQSVQICAMWVMQRHAIAFSKICKAQIEFFTNIRMTRNSEKKNKQILR